MTSNSELIDSPELHVPEKFSYTYNSLGISEDILKGLSEINADLTSSEIIFKAILLGLNGFDIAVIGQSTLEERIIFCLTALQTFLISNKSSKAMILCQNKDNALEIQMLCKSIGKSIPDWNVKVFTEDATVEEKELNIDFHVGIGLPEAFITAMTEELVDIKTVNLLIVDQGSYTASKDHQEDVKKIFQNLSVGTQIIFCSESFDRDFITSLDNKMFLVDISKDLYSPPLFNYKQFFICCQAPPLRASQMRAKSEQLNKILSDVSFNRCIVFSNFQSRVKSLSNIANENGYKSIAISDKPNAKLIKSSSVNIIFATDDTAEKIGVDEFDLVINYDIPDNAISFIDRFNWRSQTTGICINLITDKNDLKQLQNILCPIFGPRFYLPSLPQNAITIPDLLNCEIDVKESALLNIFDEIDLSIRNKIINFKAERKLNENKDRKKNKKSRKSLINNVDDCLMDILNENSNQFAELRDQLSEINTDSILQSIATGNFSFKPDILCESENQDLNCDNRKKQKLDMSRSLLEVMRSTEQANPVSNSDKMSHSIETNSEKQQIEDIFHRNKALLDVSKIISNPDTSSSTIEDCGENSIQTYLSIIRNKEREQLSGIQSEDVNTILEKLQVSEIKSDEISKISSSEDETDIIELESIFTFGYRSIIKGKNNRWKMELAKFKPEVTSGNVSDDEVSEDTSFKSTKVLYKNSNENIDLTTDGESMKWVPALLNSKDSSKTVEDANEIEIMKWVPVENSSKKVEKDVTKLVDNSLTPNEGVKISNTTQQPLEVVDSEIERYRYLENYFSNCDANLWNNGFNFTDVAAFNSWFEYDWEAQLTSIRRYVQQNIYVQEVSYYQSYVNANFE